MDAASFLLVLAIGGANVDTQLESVTPQRHTSHLAGQAGWVSDQSSPPPAAAPTGDRYQLGAISGGTTVSAPPSVVDRTRAAVIESSNALRDGVEAGIQAANRQLYQGNEQVIETAQTAGQELSNQFQGWAGTAAQQAGIAPGATGTLPAVVNTRQQVSNPFATSTPAARSAPASTAKTRGGVAPPPWDGAPMANELDSLSDAEPAIAAPRTAALSKAPVQTDRGWTSVHSSVAPPALVAPRLVNTAEAASPHASTAASAALLQPLVGDRGPSFPVTISANQPLDHSVLAQPRQAQQPPVATASANENWGLGWDGKAASQPTQPATIGNRYGAGGISAGTSAAHEPGVAASQPSATASTTTAPPSGQTPVTQPATTVGIGAWPQAADNNAWPAAPPTTQAGAVAGRDTAASAGPAASNATMPPATGSMATVGTLLNPANPGSATAVVGGVGDTPPTLQTPVGEQVPWMPLLVVSLSLAGSIGANLFLGWSYIDARQKYRTLVQKTANKFRRATTA
jgi:hypothetical protein